MVPKRAIETRLQDLDGCAETERDLATLPVISDMTQDKWSRKQVQFARDHYVVAHGAENLDASYMRVLQSTYGIYGSCCHGVNYRSEAWDWNTCSLLCPCPMCPCNPCNSDSLLVTSPGQVLTPSASGHDTEVACAWLPFTLQGVMMQVTEHSVY